MLTTYRTTPGSVTWDVDGRAPRTCTAAQTRPPFVERVISPAGMHLVEVTIGDVTIELTPDEAAELRDELDQASAAPERCQGAFCEADAEPGRDYCQGHQAVCEL